MLGETQWAKECFLDLSLRSLVHVLRSSYLRRWGRRALLHGKERWLVRTFSSRGSSTQDPWVAPTMCQCSTRFANILLLLVDSVVLIPSVPLWKKDPCDYFHLVVSNRKWKLPEGTCFGRCYITSMRERPDEKLAVSASQRSGSGYSLPLGATLFALGFCFFCLTHGFCCLPPHVLFKTKLLVRKCWGL